MTRKKANIPDYFDVPEDSEYRTPLDSCFIPQSHLFPEERENLAPHKEFPVPPPYCGSMEENRADSITLESVDIYDGDIAASAADEMDNLLMDIQAMGFQYTVFTQHCLRPGWRLNAPKFWDKFHALLLNIPVFTEELCYWHYPQFQTGYNIAGTDGPAVLACDNNTPQYFGYLPNGDLLIYWEIAEILAKEFALDLEPIQSAFDWQSAVLCPGLNDASAYALPWGHVCETGIILQDSELHHFDEVIEFVKERTNRAKATVFRRSSYIFYRFRLPVISAEIGYNLYGEALYGAFGSKGKRMVGYDFKITDNPITRNLPIFSTETGNIIVAIPFAERLKTLLEKFGGDASFVTMPIQRIP